MNVTHWILLCLESYWTYLIEPIIRLNFSVIFFTATLCSIEVLLSTSYGAEVDTEKWIPHQLGTRSVSLHILRSKRRHNNPNLRHHPIVYFYHM